MTALILDTDPGVDDAMAIAMACAHPELDLLGLTTVFGNVPVEQATVNTLSLLEQFGHPEVPVIPGAAQPLVNDPLPFPEFVHGKDGLGNIALPAPSLQSRDMTAAEFIVETSRTLHGKVTLVAIGPLTNIAMALQLEPDLPSMVAGLVVMGGALDEPGNVSPVAEANFLADPHAADLVFERDWPATIVGLDVTHRVMLYESDLSVIAQRGGSYGSLLHSASGFYIDYYTSTGAARNQPEPGCAMHDATALVYLIKPQLFSTVKGPVRIAREGIAAGQLIMDRKGYTYLLPHWKNRTPTAVCTSVDADRAKQTFLDAVTR